jgi:hypothetical protein
VGKVKDCCCAAKYEIAWLSGIGIAAAAAAVLGALAIQAHIKIQGLWDKIHHLQLQRLPPAQLNAEVFHINQEIQSLHRVAWGTFGGAMGGLGLAFIGSVGLYVSYGRRNYNLGLQEGLRRLIHLPVDQL